MSLQLAPKARQALDSIVDTFCPPTEDGFPSAAQLGVTDSLLEALARNPRAAERQALARLLAAWGSPLTTALTGGGFRRFNGLPREEREKQMLACATRACASAAPSSTH